MKRFHFLFFSYEANNQRANVLLFTPINWLTIGGGGSFFYKRALQVLHWATR